MVRAGAVVAGTGAAPVTVTGTGGAGDSTGVRIDGAGSAVSTVNGALAVTGTSVNAGPTAVGIDVVDSAALRASGAGSVALTGTSVNPDVTAGLRLTTGGRVQANTGDVTLNADEMDFAAGTSVTGNAHLFVKPLTAARGLSLGAGANQAGKLSLTAADLAAISPTFTLITIGRGDTSGAATVDGTATFGTDVVLQTPGAGSGGIRATATLSVGGNDLVLVSGSNVATAGAGLFQANTLAMFAETGIGAPGAPVQTLASNVEAKTGTGGVFIRNAVALTIGGARPDLTGIAVNASGDVEVSSGGKLTVGEGVTTKAGNVRLVARDSAAAGDDLAVLADVASQSGGSLSLRAGDNLTIDPAAKLTTSGAGTILLEVDATGADPGVGGTATFRGASLIAPAGATALGNGDNDTFTFTPSADTPITVNGATPAVAPGDALNLDLTGFTGKVLQVTELNTATATFAATAKDVKIVSVEDVNLTGGSFQVLLDLAQASLNGVPFGNGTANPDAVRVSLDGTGTDLLIAAAQNGQPLVGYFAMNLSGARGLSLAGSADRTDFSLAESAGRLPTFAGTAVGSHNDAGQLPPGTFPVGNVGLSVRGGATGLDTLALVLQTSRALSYFADLAGGGGGNVEVANALRLSFGALGGLTIDGNSGTLVADATLVNATAFTVGAGAADDGLSLIDGNGGFTDVLFGGFNQLTLRGGTGSQTMTLSSLDALDAALQGLTISGDNVRHDDPAADFLTVHALRAGLAGTLVGGAGNDVFEVVPGSMTILGDAGANRLVINGSATAANQKVTITGSTVNGGGNYNVSYQAAGGSFANGVLVLTGDGADTVTVNGTAGPTAVGTGGGDDSVTVASTAALRTRLVGTLILDAGEGDNALSVSDVGNSVGGTYDVGQSTLAGPGWRVDYYASNGSYNQLSFLAGLGNDLVRTLGVGAAHVVVNAAPGNDTLRVFVGGTNRPTGLEVRGGLGTNSLQTIDTTGGAVIRDFRTGPRSGLIQVSYQANTPTGYRYQHINAVLGINASANYIRALYRHIVGRNPILPEVIAQIGLLNAQGRLAVVHGLETSAAGRTFLVQEWFLMFFGRNPTPAESAPLVQALLAGQSEEAVLGAMLGSPTLPHTAAFRAQMVTAYYRDLLRRPPTAAELSSAVSSAQSLQAIRELIEVSEAFFLYGV
ncbi:MAG: hypothetical protein U0797_21440 [Gemmataceae bacterium]